MSDPEFDGDEEEEERERGGGGRGLVESVELDEGEDDDFRLEELGIPRYVYRRLYPYQKEGVEWLWRLRKATAPSKYSGGILGDDMGLGKTVQICAFVAGLFHSQLAAKVLVIVPLSVMTHWTRTLSDWCEDVPHRIYHGTLAERNRVMREVRMLRRPGVILSTYGTLRSNVDELTDANSPWDYVFLDEGHMVKTHTTDVAKAVRQIPSFHRLVVTGTPLQNNLRELWSLFDFAVHGQLFGDLKTFIDVFEKPILRSHERDASVGEKDAGATVAEELRARIKPHFLRRQKSEALGDAASAADVPSSADGGGFHVRNVTPGRALKAACLPRKKDLVVWVRLSHTQVVLYNGFLSSAEVRDVLNTSKSPLSAMTVLKKICDHPWILSKRSFGMCGPAGSRLSLGETAFDEAVAGRGGDGDGDWDEEDWSGSSVEDEFKLAIRSAQDRSLSLANSAKLSLTVQLLRAHKDGGHRSLVFSSSRKMLDLIEAALEADLEAGVVHFTRIDGTTPPTRRQSVLDDFNEIDSEVDCMLLTTGVGGLGLDATGADRVIIYDPHWNPVVDAQAIDRAYRIGQTRNVLVYRLITCGTIEEKIYKRQVFKGGLAQTTTQAQTATTAATPRFFTSRELREVFTLGNTDRCDTHALLERVLQSRVREETMRAQVAPFEPHLSWVLARSEAIAFTHNDLVLQVAPTLRDREDDGQDGRTADRIGSDPTGSEVCTPVPPVGGSRRSSVEDAVTDLRLRGSRRRGRIRVSSDSSSSDGGSSSSPSRGRNGLEIHSLSEEDAGYTAGRGSRLGLDGGLRSSDDGRGSAGPLGRIPFALDGEEGGEEAPRYVEIDLTTPEAQRTLRRSRPTRTLPETTMRTSSSSSVVDLSPITTSLSAAVDDGSARRWKDTEGAAVKSGDSHDVQVIDLNGSEDHIDLTDSPPPVYLDVSGEAASASGGSVMSWSNALNDVSIGNGHGRLQESSMRPLAEFSRVRTLHSRSSLRPSQMEEYDELLQRANSSEEAGNDHETLQIYMQMLDICDEDPWLHHRALKLCLGLGVLTPDDFGVHHVPSDHPKSLPEAGQEGPLALSASVRTILRRRQTNRSDADADTIVLD